ncbi:succinate-semialdehyde dehydrogenase/glutarate-semialdehyde dehydrogenase [Flavobacterium sp. CG_23.5]|uniref:NAD-dependent succinate-semialdehyde dehydrogenase n=1 Tax=unclassified Flavobacterium TaxID=196869 RepID=UPI0018C9514B|nr:MULTISPECIES: NAD-dependent succinate-semialdehyde dehydrogenase [unclassified Flavobacterium]MBG6111349.1 succinate-semialdehyde dehydrogenase/glutarate-semialdehyde dehydrogenase [Flavobacterium sp. CG_9.10]MBP2282137.1 succinate-semialdehyde dehydrogenase/glutarate-semialdehyde dehydrogenase [Flavobacterium sp. CG_23.5]
MAKTIGINPATGEKISEYDRITGSQALEIIAASKKEFHHWKEKTFAERATLMYALADVLDENKEEYAQLATREMGKVIGQARKEVEKCAWICRYYAEHANTLLANETVKTEATKSYVTFQPIGVILAVMPWNFPFYQAIRFAIPALMAGNTGVLKHATNVQGCAFAIEEAFIKAGFPKGVFMNLNVDAKEVKILIEDKNIAAITLTGSDAAGRSIASIAGQNLKKTVMELGGSDAYIILDDVDLEEATDLATLGRLQNNGQTCIAAKRFIVHDAIYDAFLALFTKKMKAAKMGDPTSEDSYYGPMARLDLRDELHAQVEKTIKQGGRLVLGGVIPEGKGAYYPASILVDLKPGMEAFDNELFGPVASVIRAKDDNHAIELANNSQFGLGSGVFTKNRERGEKLALRLEAGSSFVNKLVVSDPRLPFGGIKNSGYGRELAAYGIREFVNTKTIWID